jgi:multisite-specific tRNA:(cytosine-C5)-methyltransferase
MLPNSDWNDGTSWSFLVIIPSTSSHLESIRIYPHLQDTGAFFVAVLQRIRPSATPWDDPIVGRSKYVNLRPSVPTFNTIICRERKREADDITQEDGAKRLKLDIDESDSERLPEVDLHTPVNEVNKADAPKGKGRTSVKSSEPDSSFKEHPYTYVAVDDPVLRLCM